jgi:hypothetical protein
MGGRHLRREHRLNLVLRLEPIEHRKKDVRVLFRLRCPRYLLSVREEAMLEG